MQPPAIHREWIPKVTAAMHLSGLLLGMLVLGLQETEVSKGKPVGKLKGGKHPTTDVT